MNIIRISILKFGGILMIFGQGVAAIKRLEHFQLSEERTNEEIIKDETLETGVFKVNNASFEWDSNEAKEHTKKFLSSIKKKDKVLNEENIKLNSPVEIILKNINFENKKGEFILVIGTVGSGKSSFLSCLNGEMILKVIYIIFYK